MVVVDACVRTGVGFPCVIMFLANADNLSGKLNFFTWVNVALASTLGSVGAAPVPSAGDTTCPSTVECGVPICHPLGCELLVN